MARSTAAIEHQPGHEPPWACGLLAFLPTRQADRPLHLKDFAQHIGTKDLSRAAHHVRRAEQAGLMRKIGWVGGWVAMG